MPDLVIAGEQLREAVAADAFDAVEDVTGPKAALRERGISAGRLQAGIKSSPLDVVIDGMAEGCKVIWH